MLLPKVLVDDGLARSWALDGRPQRRRLLQELLVRLPVRLHCADAAPTRAGSEAAAWLARGAEVENSLVCGGTRVAGSVAGSVLSPGVVIEAGARVRLPEED